MDRQDVKPVQIIRGNALTLPLADDSVDLVVTSPPYFGLRSYQDGGEHYAGQIGDEPTPAATTESAPVSGVASGKIGSKQDGSQPRCVNTSTGSLTADSTPALPGGISG